MSLPDGPLVAWYGDDFTGAAAVAEVLEFAGLPSMVFLAAPDPAILARAGVGLRGVGIAGDARVQGIEWMDRELPGVFRWLTETGAPIRHYKVCSTLDSSPSIGSIGRAMELGLAAVDDRAGAVPVLIGAPAMGRWVAFGQLFARASGGIFRLDRHPVMARHPVTPMDEADIACHLAQQTALPMSNLMLPDLGNEIAARAAWAEAGEGAQGLILDAADEAQMALLGRILWKDAARIPFVVGSQGVEMALVAHWGEAGRLPPPPAPRDLGRAERFAAVSGSVSPTTAEQIDAAEAAGFVAIPLDTPAIVSGGADVTAAVEQALAALESGRSPVVHTALGPADPRVAVAGIEVSGDRIGAALAHVLGALIDRGGVTRAIIAGGDTSGRVAQALGIAALRPLAHVAPGASVMRAFSSAPERDGLELVLKGGQMGQRDLFARVRDGRATQPTRRGTAAPTTNQQPQRE